MDFFVSELVGKKVKSMSGWIWFIYSLNALESLAKREVSTNFLIVGGSVSPLIEVIMYFNLVDNSGFASLFNLLSPSNSCFTFISSPCVKSLKVIEAPAPADKQTPCKGCQFAPR